MNNAGKSAGKGGNVYDQAAGAYGQAGNAFQQAGNLYSNPGVQPGPAQNASLHLTSGAGYNPSQTGGAGYNALNAQGAGYNAMNTGGAGYNAAAMNAASSANPAAISSGIGQYMNPFTSQVINKSLLDLQRQTNMQQDQNAAGAVNAGAFGGSRHGLVEAQTNAESQRIAGELSSGLRMQGFDTAAGLSGQDIANRMGNNQFNASLLQQGRMQNQDATNIARQFGAANQMTANLSNQNAGNTARQFGAGNQMTANLSNQAAGNVARQFGAGNQMTANLANQDARNTAGQFGAANQMTANLANQAARSNTSQFNANTQNQRDMENVNSQFARASGLAGLGQQAAGLGGALFNTGQEINADQMGAGSLQQQLLQQVLSGAAGQYDQFMGMPQNLLNMQLAALGMNPLTTATSTTGSYKPGLLDWASLLGQTATGMSGKGGATP